jgi:hypothetical protein
MCSHFSVYHSIQVWFCFILDSSKMGYTLQTMSYVDFTLYSNTSSHLGQGHRQTSVTYFCLCLLPYQFFCLPCPLFLLERFLIHSHKTPSSFRFLHRKTWHRKRLQSLFESKILQMVQSLKCKKIHKGNAMVFQCKYFNWKCKHISQFTHLVWHVL